MSLITTKSYHDMKLINYINNLSELDKTQLLSNKILNRKLIGIYYDKNDKIQLEYYETIKKYYVNIFEITKINLESNLDKFILVICLDPENVDIIDQCYNLNILVVSNNKQLESDTEFVNNYCICYKSIKDIINIIDIINSSETFGIIIPVYNCEKYVEKAIVSILSQTYKNYVIYMIDDCSTDNSLQIINKYKHLPNVIISSNDTNLGKFMSINKMLPNIKTNYYLILDSDDIIIKNRLIYDMIEFTRCKNIFAVASKWYRYNETNNLLVTSPYFCANNCTYKTEIINKIGVYWNTRFGGDSEYIERFNKFIGSKYILYSNQITCIAIHRFDKNNLTLQVPLGSTKRKNFVNLYRKYHNEIYKDLKFLKNKDISISKVFNTLNYENSF